MSSPTGSPRRKRKKMCQDFVTVSGTDSKLAVHFLEKASWDNEKALNMYFESDLQGAGSQDGDGAGAKESQPSGRTVNPSDKPSSSKEGPLPDSQPKRQTASPTQITFITWNVDGLCQRGIVERTSAICQILKSKSPDIIFLQEVIPLTFSVFSEKLKDYTAIPAGNKSYFTLVLLKKASVTSISSEVEPFPETGMGRAVQIVQCQCAGLDLRLMCSHLESTASGAAERKRQFSRVLNLMKTAPKKETVLFGGDTNLRDKEVAKVGLPSYIHDVWELMGSPVESKFTWDVLNNDNLDWPFPSRPRLRFDRLYLRQAAPDPRVAPATFSLLGKERLPSCDMFPSDHWGILCTLRVLDKPDT